MTFPILLTVPPTRARLVREWSYFLSGQTYEVRCVVEGAHPTADVVAAVGGKELNVAYGQEDEGEDGAIRDEVTVAIRFVPTKEDDERFLSCRLDTNVVFFVFVFSSFPERKLIIILQGRESSCQSQQRRGGPVEDTCAM